MVIKVIGVEEARTMASIGLAERRLIRKGSEMNIVGMNDTYSNEDVLTIAQ